MVNVHGQVLLKTFPSLPSLRGLRPWKSLTEKFPMDPMENFLENDIVGVWAQQWSHIRVIDIDINRIN